MPVKGGNYWLGPLFLISQAAESLELWWGGRGRDRLVATLHQSLKHTFPGTCRPLPLTKATEARWLEGCGGALGPCHESGPVFLISLGLPFSCAEWAQGASSG